jgi:hypothetical protein
MDYAILQLDDTGADLIPIPISIRAVDSDTDLKVFHCPVGLFTDGNQSDVTVFTGWVKSGRPTRHHIPCNGGLFSGSSGGPFVTREGYAVGMHIESINSARGVESSYTGNPQTNFDILSSSCNSNANNHASISSALCLGSCRKLVTVLRSITTNLDE